MGPAEERNTGAAWLAGALGFVAAGIMIVTAWATSALACDEPTSNACGRHGLATGQLAVALAGLIPVGLMVWSVWRSERARAWAWLAVAIVTYVVWGVLNDAAVHGW